MTHMAFLTWEPGKLCRLLAPFMSPEPLHINAHLMGFICQNISKWYNVIFHKRTQKSDVGQTHICFGDWDITCPGNGLSPIRHQIIPQPVLTYCRLDPKEYISKKVYFKFKYPPLMGQFETWPLNNTPKILKHGYDVLELAGLKRLYNK